MAVHDYSEEVINQYLPLYKNVKISSTLGILGLSYFSKINNLELLLEEIYNYSLTYKKVTEYSDLFTILFKDCKEDDKICNTYITSYINDFAKKEEALNQIQKRINYPVYEYLTQSITDAQFTRTATRMLAVFEKYTNTKLRHASMLPPVHEDIDPAAGIVSQEGEGGTTADVVSINFVPTQQIVKGRHNVTYGYSIKQAKTNTIDFQVVCSNRATNLLEVIDDYDKGVVNLRFAYRPGATPICSPEKIVEAMQVQQTDPNQFFVDIPPEPYHPIISKDMYLHELFT
uniref:MSP domain-containing protein n=1 Tax=Strongyloides papillosus TaxID=174720 RepID=A0A0N5B4Q5_STREA